MIKISVTIITLNEEKNIRNAIQSASFADEIIVVDSNSSDNTKRIASSLGAKVYNEEFKGHGRQKNIAAMYCSNDLILNIDADEVISEELKKEIIELTDNNSIDSLYSIPRKNYFCGKWIRYGGWYPDLNARLYLKNHAKWTEPYVHEVLQSNNGKKPISLKSDILHNSFITFESQVITNLKYAKLGAKNLINKKGSKTSFLLLLFKPISKFFECYLLKRGFLDGKSGLLIAINASYSIFLKYAFIYMGDLND